MPNTYHPAPQVGAVAKKLVAAHHDHLLTNGVYVKFLFCEQPEKVRGREALGTARKISGLNAYLALRDDPEAPRARDESGPLLVSEFFLITIYRDFWRARDTTDHQRRALVDHELMHCWSEEQVNKDGHPTGKILLSILPHDLEEFHVIAQRYGAWRPDIETFTKALRAGQPSLFDGADLDTEEDEPALKTLTISGAGRSVTMNADRALRGVAAGRGN